MTEELKPNTAIVPLKLEPDAYVSDLDGLDMTEAQKIELLQTLWTIMTTMVDIGWGVDTVQLLLPELFAEIGENSENTVTSKNAFDFNTIAQTRKDACHDG